MPNDAKISKNSMKLILLGVILTPIAQQFVDDANITGTVGTILGYLPLIFAVGVLLRQMDFF